MIRKRYHPDYIERRKAALKRKLDPFADLLSISGKEMDDEELAERILVRLSNPDLHRNIAWWIAKQRDHGPGRPSGSQTSTLPKRAEAILWMKRELTRSKQRWYRNNHRERITDPSVRAQLFNEVKHRAADRYPGLWPPIEIAEVERQN